MTTNIATSDESTKWETPADRTSWSVDWFLNGNLWDCSLKDMEHITSRSWWSNRPEYWEDHKLELLSELQSVAAAARLTMDLAIEGLENGESDEAIGHAWCPPRASRGRRRRGTLSRARANR